MSLTETLIEIMEHRVIRYKGCRIEHKAEGYVFNRKAYATIQEAKGAIDEVCVALAKSISN